MCALQFKTGEQAGAWAWLNFHYEPWESGDAPYYGAALAAVAIGIAPENYGSAPALKDRSSALAQYFRRTMDKQPLFNRVMLLWASSRSPGLVSAAERRGLVEGVAPSQQPDGGWSLASLGSWKRSDGTPLDQASDGYATGLITFALLEAGVSPTQAGLSRTRMARTASEPIRWQVDRFFAEQAAGSCVRCRQVHERCGNRVRRARADRRAGRPEIGRPFRPSVRRRAFDFVDDDHIDRRFRRLELQTKLLLNR